MLVLAVGLAGVGVWVRQRLNTPYREFVGEEVFVDIPAGSSVAAIGNRLVAAGVLPDPWTFRLAARATGADRHLQAGEYRFAGASTPLTVMQRLAAGDVFRLAVTFPEGLTIAEMAETFARSGLGTSRDFIAAASEPAVVASYGARLRSLEGYLFPDTYPLARTSAASDVIRAMLTRFDQVFTPELRGAAAARGWTVHEVLTLASLIEKETARADERPIVAAVYLNRLKIGMALQCDPTVVYALMQARRWDGNIRKGDLQIDSPYNTYRVRGLPPGPIASPGRASIEAALKPADVAYLYFVSRNDGTHVFATTLAEHDRNVHQWQGKRN
jgi:peptidoglycan lytic transglycosylase G